MMRQLLCWIGLWRCDRSKAKALAHVNCGMQKLYRCTCGWMFTC